MTYYGWLTEGSAFAQKPLLGKGSRDYGLDALKGVEIIESLHSDVVRTEGLRESIAALLERRDRL